ncbi:hypothetical protein PsorP6_002793 [Peronosclerospora sorghi]|uniref:Uncharacterized protein n=1 Tax=Peronosclerospora sorghi TaxID=230839 RepID=A0ACC0VLL8_9STRA|nr:hypothetical protein PsorP6_002793 [Peronosclerospora sorghi]
MQTLEEESKRVLKKQRLCVAQIDRQLDELLSHVETTKQKLEEQQRDLFRRKKIHLGTPSTSEARQGKETRLVTGDDGAAQVSTNEKHSLKGTDASDNYKSPRNDVGVESQENETEYIVRDFIRRVRQLNIEQNVASELKAMHILLSKYSKFIEQNLYTDITKICRAKDFDQKVVCRLVAEYLYQDGQIQAADALCDEARLVLSPTLKECFTELHQMLKAIRKHDMQPALDWARKHRHELKQLDIEIEFELVRLKYVNILEASPDTMDAVCFANTELSYFHQTHAEEVGVLMSCVLYKGKLKESPYKHLFNDNRWDEIYDAVIRACCRLRNVPHRSYLETWYAFFANHEGFDALIAT